MQALFSPRGVVVVGASASPGKLGYSVAQNMRESGYQGEVHYVNPKGGELFGKPIHTSVGDVPDPADLAVILIPAPYVPASLEECGKRGIPFAIIGSGGFGESSPEGKKLEEQTLAVARSFGIRVIGPNCVGYIDTHLPINTSFLPVESPKPGNIAFISQSGAICDIIIDLTRGQGYGLSRLLSIGNQMDIKESELFAPTAADPHTKVIAVYLEGVFDGAQFIREASAVTREKPIVVMKVGRSESGRAAVASHTGALAGSDNAYTAAFRRAGVLRALRSEELFEWARVLAWAPLPRGRRMAVLTNAGGCGTIMTDTLVDHGMELAQFSAATRANLQSRLPEAANTNNPVDMLAQAGPDEFSLGLKDLLADEGVDGVMVLLPPPPVSTPAEIAEALIPVIREAKKPVLATFMGEEQIITAVEVFMREQIPFFRYPEQAASAMSVLCQRSRQLQKPAPEWVTLTDVHKDQAQAALADAVVGADGFLEPGVLSRMAQAYGIPLPPEKIVHSEQEAVEEAQKMGFPVVLKVVSADIPHKSDVGGIALDIRDVEAAAQAYRQVTALPLEKVPGAVIEGALLQKMLPEGQEVIVGAVRDPQFGPLLMFGSGGVEVEALGDVSFGLTPVDRREVETMLEETWAGRKLKGYRGFPACDREAVVDVLARIGRLMEDFPELSELEINPLRVFPGEEGAVAPDLRARVTREPTE
ncbi:MAG: acetate--CoA ligase family protein [Anaerolineales bacterium]|nr:acetate--CoA ligase family protein [Anaerolineales bacterium]